MHTDKNYIIGNWKSNKTAAEVKSWFDYFNRNFQKKNLAASGQLEIVICPSFIHLNLVKALIEKYQLPLKKGAQNCSPFEVGSYTGEVAASQLKELAEYVIIGHSERRKYFHENEKILEEKVKKLKEKNLEIIFCVQDDKTPIPEGVKMVAYEPVWAIGTGRAESPHEANKVAASILEKRTIKKVIYGGSVTPENIKGFLQEESITGVLPGKSSLDPALFWQMITNAAI